MSIVAIQTQRHLKPPDNYDNMCHYVVENGSLKCIYKPGQWRDDDKPTERSGILDYFKEKKR